MCWRFYILIVVLALTIETTAGVQCFNCVYKSQSRWCMSPNSNRNKKDFAITCDGNCSVELGQFGNMGLYRVGANAVLMKRGCPSDDCKMRKINCCQCSYDFCNEDNLCGNVSHILLPSISFVIGGILFVTMCTKF